MPSVFTLSGAGRKKPKAAKKSRTIDSTLPRPSRAQVKAMLGPFATSAQVDRHFKQYGNGLGGARDKKACPRIPKKNVEWTQIPKGTKVVDCGHLYVAKLKSGSAVVFWGSRDASQAQTTLKRLAAKR